MVRIAFSQNVVNVMMGNTVKVAWAVIPKDVDNREVLKVSACYIEEEEGFGEGKGGMDDNVDGY